MDSITKVRADLLTAAEERELAARIGGGDEADARLATARLVECNVRLALGLAARYFPWGRKRGLGADDLAQEAISGLFSAARGFDPDRGRFTTIATRHVRSACRRAILNAGLVHVPAWLQDSRDPVATAARRSVGPPSPGRTAWRVAALEHARVAIVAAVQEAGPDGEAAILTIAARGEPPDPFDDVRDALPALLAGLPERSARVLTLRYGLGGGEPMTLRAVGVVLGITRERVRQVEAVAIMAMRSAAIREGMEVGA